MWGFGRCIQVLALAVLVQAWAMQEVFREHKQWQDRPYHRMHWGDAKL
jgi:hypothetical protein